MTLPTAPAAERNKQPILEVLRPLLPASGAVLEIASGTGQHICHFAQELPGIRWQPTEPGIPDLATIAARIAAAGLANVAAPLALDVLGEWPLTGPFDAVVCINMIHISPWAATEALLRGAADVLAPRGYLVLYGPYLEHGAAAPSNLDFDASLKRRNAEWGLRELEEVTQLAASHGLLRTQVVRMPANNLTVVFANTA